MKKYHSIRFRMLFLVALLISGFVVTFVNYQEIEQRETYINKQISLTLKSERLIESIEKLTYYNALYEIEDTSVVELMAGLNDNYDDYTLVFPEFVDVKVIDDYGYQLNQLHQSIENQNALSYDFEDLLMKNSLVKDALIKAIRDHATSSRNVFMLMVVIMICIMSLTAIIIYREVIIPLKHVTKSINAQHEKLVINEIESINSRNEFKYLIDGYNRLVKKNMLVSTINEKIYSRQRFDDIFDFIYDNLKPFIPYDRIGIAVITPDGMAVEAIKARSSNEIVLGRGYKLDFSKTSLMKVIEDHDIRIINDLDDYLIKHPKSESTRLMIEENMKASMTLPLFHEEKAVGVVFFSSTAKDVYLEEHKRFLINIANALGTSMENSFVYENMMISTVRSFAKMVESKDNVTGNHIDRISYYSGFVAKKLVGDFEEIDDDFIRRIKRLSPLHDIGKVSIPDNILNKPGRLDDDEMTIMKTHSLHGAEVLEELLGSVGDVEFKMAADIAKYHHEKINGMGYPEGLEGDAIPLAARIVALVDVFDALTSERPYKKAFDFEQAIDILKKDAGSHFDQVIVDRLMEHLEEFEALYKKLWTS
ncbi:HD domain-containing protein [Acidaminobacter sp. JC074]|uniref:HD-GYP domain-containing protein n=1 Tax=Acidaminobacter sp. JC074 TaxID=2530199 RepID=UPI001F0D82CD|nr:HD domain-containing phosphohydrolase [Acidaminobacter sp. JC074]MCH4888658.1 HD domain-containing protein [Acidaminobacter sp. JC074]